MQPKNPLFHLVRNLSKSELRHFQLFTGKPEEGSSSYMALFKELLKYRDRDDFDEAALKKELHEQGQIDKGSFAATKKYLFNLLLQSLRKQREKKEPDIKAMTLFQESRILFEKGLPEDCMKRLEKARTDAQKYERYPLLIDILEYKGRLQLKYPQREEGLYVRNQALSAECLRVLELLRTEMLYQNIKNQAFALFKTKSRSRGVAGEHEQRIQALRDALEGEQLPVPGSFRSKRFAYTARAFLSTLENKKGENRDALRYYRKVIEVWEEYPAFREVYTEDYKLDVYNYLSLAHSQNDYSEFETMLKEMSGDGPAPLAEEINDFEKFEYLRLLALLNQQGRLEDALVLARKILEKLYAFNDKNYPLTTSREIAFYHNIALAFFINGQFEEALEMVNKLMKQPKKLEERSDIRHFASVLRQVIFFELGEDDKIDNTQQYTKTLLEKNDMLSELEDTVLRYIRKLNRNALREEQQKVFGEFYAELDGLRGKYARLPGLHILWLWARSRHEQKDMAALYNELLEKGELF